MTTVPRVPYRCPKCGDLKSFSSLRELKVHLDEEHSFRNVRAPQERQRSRIFTPLSKQKYTPRRERSGRLSPLSLSFSEDARALEERLKRAKEAENAHQLSHRVGPDGHNQLNDTITMLSRGVMQARQNQWNASDALYHSHDVLEDLQVSAERQSKQQTTSMAQLRNDLDQKERNLSKVSKDVESLTRERIKLEAEKMTLSQRMEESSGKITNLESQMKDKTEMLKQKEREYNELMKFLEGAAKKESLAREKLEDFINSILDRAERAELQVQQMKNQMNAPPVPKDVLSYLAHTRSPPSPQQLTSLPNGVGLRSPVVKPQHSPHPLHGQPVTTEPGYPPQAVPTYTLYNAAYDPPRVSPQTTQSNYSKLPVPRKPRANKASPSQSVRSRDSGIPEEVMTRDKSRPVSHSPHHRPTHRDYQRYQDESDYEDYTPKDVYSNEEDYSLSQSEAPNLAMLGNVSDSPNEFYHSSDEGIPDYYLDSDGILWDESVLANGKPVPSRVGLRRTSPSGSESGGQIVQTSNPSDIYANTIKARTAFSSSYKPSFQNQAKSGKSTNNVSSNGSPHRAKSPSVTTRDDRPYNKEDYIKSVKNRASPNSSNNDSGIQTKSKDKLKSRSAHGLSRQNSSSSGEGAAPQSPSSQNSSNTIVATADVHVSGAPSPPDKPQKRPVPAQRGVKPQAHSDEAGPQTSSHNNRNSHGSYPRDREKSEHLLLVKEEAPQFNSLPTPSDQKRSSHSEDTPVTSESTDLSSAGVKRQPIKKQSSVGKINSTDRPPKPSRQQSSVSSTSPEDSQTGSEVGKVTSSSLRSSFDSDDKTDSKRGRLQPKLSRDLSINVPGDSIHSVSPIRIQMEDLQMMTDIEEDIVLHDTGVGPSGPLPADRLEEIKKRRLILLCIFLYLDTKTLSQLSLVCKEWKVVSRHPALWRRVRLRNARVSSQYLMTISKWCVQLQSLTLEGLKPRRKRKGESDEDYAKSTRGSLEQGLETLLRVSQNSLISLRIANCDNILSERCLWEVSCYSRLLQRLCYISGTDPLGPEVMWNMGAGCRDIVTLIVPPGLPNKKPDRFNNKCVQLIGQFYPELKVLSIGGANVDERGLLPLVKQCQRLQVLELDHMKEISEEVAQSLCDAGLKDLQTLEFTNTPVTPKAVHLFSKHCRHLHRINLRVAISDYFEDTLRKENVDYFRNVVEKFNSLKKRSNLSRVLKIKTDAEGKERLRST